MITRWKKQAVDGMEGTFSKLKNRVPEQVEKAVLDLALDDPSLGQKRVSDTLRQKGVFISPGGVRSVWLRHGLETFKKRLAAL
jgi:transposase-like protein